MNAQQGDFHGFPFSGQNLGQDPRDRYDWPENDTSTRLSCDDIKTSSDSNTDAESGGGDLDSLSSITEIGDVVSKINYLIPTHSSRGGHHTENKGGEKKESQQHLEQRKVALNVFNFATRCFSDEQEEFLEKTESTVNDIATSSSSAISSLEQEYDLDLTDEDGNLLHLVYGEPLAKKLSELWFDRTKTPIHESMNCKDTTNAKERYHIESFALEKVQAREMFEMNFGEREAINNEIHGVESRCVHETPAMIASALLNLQHEINAHLDDELLDRDGKNLGNFTKTAHKRGLQLQSAYIQSNSFRLRFLRKSLYDVKDAAIQYFFYLDWISCMFGDNALLRPLFLSDLTKREIKYLKKGQQQILPSRDRAGRRIYAFVGCNNTEYTHQEKYRVQAYLFDVLAQDEACQKLGFIYLGFIQRSGKIHIDRTKGPMMLRRSNMACPLRLSAFHLCYPDSILSSFVQAVVFLATDKNFRSKIRYHSGSQIENNYHLCGYGIPSGAIPMTFSGVVKTKCVAKFIKARNYIEKCQKAEIQKDHARICQQMGINVRSSTIRCNHIPKGFGVECPDSNFVVFGDKKLHEHPGNVRFRSFLQEMDNERMIRIVHCDQTVSSNINFVHEVISKALTPRYGFCFYDYNRTHCIYETMKDSKGLHRRVHLMLQDIRKRFRPSETFCVPMMKDVVLSTNHHHHHPTADPNDPASQIGVPNPFKRKKMSPNAFDASSPCEESCFL